MAYDKHTWACREPITAEKLNHMEEGIANAGGDCDCGYECTETVTTLTEESVTTVAHGDNFIGMLSYSQLIDAESIKVTLNGAVYECEKTVTDGNISYGASYDPSTGTADWSEYPFVLASDSNYGNALFTETAGTYSIKVESVSIDVTTSRCFCAAVNKCVQGNGKLIEAIGGGTCPDNQTTYNVYNITWDEILQGIHDGVTFWLVNAALGDYSQIITFSLAENASDYTVKAYRYDEQSVTPLTLYGDTTDGYLRDVRCAMV